LHQHGVSCLACSRAEARSAATSVEPGGQGSDTLLQAFLMTPQTG